MGGGGGGWRGVTGMLKKRNRIEHLRGTNLGVAQPRPQDSPMFYEKKKPYGQDWTCLRPIKEIILQHRRICFFCLEICQRKTLSNTLTDKNIGIMS